jgi:hypothetical protein
MSTEINTKTVFCVPCNKEVDARITNGKEICPDTSYPDLYNAKFLICDNCKSYQVYHAHTKTLYCGKY